MDDPRIDTVLDGRYRILQRIASGGMGVVYRGERVKLGRSVAVKFLHAWLLGDESFTKRFEIEARAMARLQHPNCASVIDFGVDGEEPYVVMDLATGESLRTLMDRERIPVTRAIETIRQVLAGLAHAHEQGITHRDIKPDNVMVDSSSELGDQVRILDFGLAKMREGSTALTIGFVVGTPAYMAPEQALAQAVDARTDVYAAGVVLFEMLTGRKPFEGDEIAEVLRQHREDPPPRLSEADPSTAFSPELEAVVAQALAKAPDDRYLTAAELAIALDMTPEGSHGRAASADPTVAPVLATPPGGDSAPLLATTRGGDSAPALAAPPGGDSAPALGTTPAPVAAPTSSVEAASNLGVAPTAFLTQDGSQAASPAGSQPSETSALDVISPRPSADPGSSVRLPGSPDPSYSPDAGVSSPGMAIRPGSGGRRAAPRTPWQPGRTRRNAILAVVGGVTLIVLIAVGASSDEPTPAGDGPLASPAKAIDHDDEENGDDDDAPAEPFDDADQQGDDPDVSNEELAASETPEGKPEPPELTQIKKRIAAGRLRGAIDSLQKLQRKYPDNAEIPYLMGKLYFAKVWSSQGVRSFRAAIARDPRYRSDANVIRGAIRGLTNDKYHYQVRRFLIEEIGEPALPYLEDAARGHRFRSVRVRAKRIVKVLRRRATP